MRNFVLSLSTVLRAVSLGALWISAVGLVFMTAFIAYQVFGRFVLNDTPTWTESGSVLLMGWFILLGAAVGIREGNHLSFDVLLFIMPDSVNKVLFTLSDLVVIAFGGGMVYYGVQLAARTWSTTIPNLGFSGAVAFFALIGGGILVVCFSLERVLRRLVGLPTSRFGEVSIEEAEA